MTKQIDDRNIIVDRQRCQRRLMKKEKMGGRIGGCKEKNVKRKTAPKSTSSEILQHEEEDLTTDNFN